MKYIWEKGEQISLSKLMTDVNERYQLNWKRSTVRTFLGRMQEKGYVNLHRKGRYSYISPRISLDAYKTAIVCYIIREWYSGSPSALVRDICQKSKLSHSEVSRIEEILNELVC